MVGKKDGSFWKSGPDGRSETMGPGKPSSSRIDYRAEGAGLGQGGRQGQAKGSVPGRWLLEDLLREGWPGAAQGAWGR